MSSNQQKPGCLGILLAPFLNKRPTPSSAQELPYAKRDKFLSPAEISFFHVLKGVLNPDQYLLTKVNLADIFYVRQPHINKGARNRINRKHVDYLVCDAATMTPLIAIELDDASHQRADRKERDAFVDQVFATAELPLLHVPASKGYVSEQIHQQIENHLSTLP